MREGIIISLVIVSYYNWLSCNVVCIQEVLKISDVLASSHTSSIDSVPSPFYHYIARVGEVGETEAAGREDD